MIDYNKKIDEILKSPAYLEKMHALKLDTEYHYQRFLVLGLEDQYRADTLKVLDEMTGKNVTDQFDVKLPEKKLTCSK